MPRRQAPVIPCLEAGPPALDAIPGREARPEAAPGKRPPICGIQLLACRGVAQRGPLLEVRVQPRGAEHERGFPGAQVAGEGEPLAQVRRDGRVQTERVHEVHGRVRDRAQDVRRHGDGPGDAVLRGEAGEEVFLRVVEVGLERDARVVFFLGGCGRPEVHAGERVRERTYTQGGGVRWVPVVFGSGLEQDAFGADVGEGKRFAEVLE